MARRAISGMIARYVEGLPEIATQFPAYNHQVFCLTAYGLLPPEHAAADRGRTDPLHINRQSGIVMADITAYAHLLSYQGAGGAGSIVIFRCCGCAASQQHGGTECRTSQCFHVPILGV